MSIASEITRLQQAKRDLKTAIENKGVPVGNITLDRYAAKVNAIQDTHNAFKVNSIQERDALTDVADGDVCVVQESNIKPITEEIAIAGFDSMLISDTIILDAPTSGYYSCMFRDDNYTIDLNIDIDSSSARMAYYNRSSGVMYHWEYSSQDGITYTLDSGEPAGNYDFGTTVHWENYGDPWNDAFGYFLQTGLITFEGVFQASVSNNTTTWDYLDVGISSVDSDILLNKKAYTNNGTIVGTRDMNKYVTKGYLISDTEPEDPDAYPYWIKLYSEITTNYYQTRSPVIIDNNIDIITPEVTALDLNFNQYWCVYNDEAYLLCTTSSDSTIKLRKVNFTTGVITTLATLPYAAETYQYVISEVVNGIIYIFISLKTNYSSRIFYSYNINNNTFTRKADTPTNWSWQYVKLLYHKTTNSIVYGSNNNIFKYNISANTWTTITSSNLPYILSGRCFHMNIDNVEYILIGGGANSYLYKETTNYFEQITYSLKQKTNGADYNTSWLNVSEQLNGNNFISVPINDNYLQYPIISYDISLENNIMYVNNFKSYGVLNKSINTPHSNSNNLTKIGSDLYYLSNHNSSTACRLVRLPNIFNTNGTLNTNRINISADKIYNLNGDTLNSGFSLRITDCFLYNNTTPSVASHTNAVEKVYLYNSSTQQYEVIIDHS